MKSLKDLLPQIETDWLLPVWLLIAVGAAFVAETVIIGTGVDTIYALWVGWPIGLTIASTQAIGSMMSSNAMMHNARRKIVTKKGPKNGPERVENLQRSEPALSSGLPFAISVLAGVASAIVGLALYSVNGGLDLLDFTLAVVSPLGSICAALLNGIFASGELAIRNWQIQEGIIVVEVAGEGVGEAIARIEVASNANDMPDETSDEEGSNRIAYEEWMALQARRLATNGGTGFTAKQMVEELGLPQRTAYNWLGKYKQTGILESES